jgi:micrococcal nuclease
MRAIAPLLILAQACGSPCGPASATVVRIIDGDTVELDSLSRVRLLMIDTPEITDGKNDCYGVEAAELTSGLLLGQVVQLAYDADECTDRYGRTLAYLTVGGVDVSAELVREGAACVLALGATGARVEALTTSEAEARTRRVGMWGQCTTISCVSPAAKGSR